MLFDLALDYVIGLAFMVAGMAIVTHRESLTTDGFTNVIIGLLFFTALVGIVRRVRYERCPQEIEQEPRT